VTVYNAAGREIQLITPLNHTTYVGYDALGRTVSVTDALGHLSRTGYDAVGRVASMTHARLYVTTFLYDERNLLTGVQTANGAITSHSYDHRGDLCTVMNHLGVLTADYTRDGNGNVSVVVDGRGVRLTCTYDPLDRLKTVQYPDNTYATQETNHWCGSVPNCARYLPRRQSHIPRNRFKPPRPHPNLRARRDMYSRLLPAD
jgi:YD repeat-containing protein